MPIGTLLIYIFIGVGATLVIGALIYTKLIKPANLSYTSKNMWIKYQLKNLFKDLIKQHKLVRGYEDAVLNILDSPLVVLDYLYFGHDQIYVLSSCLYWNIQKVEFNGNKFQVTTKRNKTQDLPLDVQVFLKSIKNLKKVFNLSQELVIIVPSLNKNFSTVQINNVHFMYYENITNLINSLEHSENSQIKDLQQAMLAKLRVKRKRTILPRTQD